LQNQIKGMRCTKNQQSSVISRMNFKQRKVEIHIVSEARNVLEHDKKLADGVIHKETHHINDSYSQTSIL
jgi:hypothetical protein